MKKKKAPLSYRQRKYRQRALRSGLVSTFVSIRETDLHILAERKVTNEAREAILRYRTQLEGYFQRRTDFCDALHPLASDPLAPALIQEMLNAGQAAGVGPMAAVAGVIAEYVGRDIAAVTRRNLIVENGGDIYL